MDPLKASLKTALFIIIATLTPVLFLSFLSSQNNSTSTPPLNPSPSLESETAGLIKKVTVGHSVHGKPIDGYIIGSGENVILLHSAMHGDEMGTAELLKRLVDEIQATPQIVATNTKLIILPIVNPDGYYDRTDKLNANEVNLNLNFQTTDWQEYGPEGTYAGPEPFSEIESQIIKKIVGDYKPLAMIAFHSEGALVSPEADEHSIALAEWYAKKSGYSYFADWDFPGTATKWFVEATSKPAITVELTTQFEDDWEINKTALLELVSTDISSLIK